MQEVPGVDLGKAQTLLLASLLHLNCGADAMDDKQLAVSSNQGNAGLFSHLTLGIMEEQY